MADEDVSTGELYRILQRIEKNMVSKDSYDEVIRAIREDHRIDVEALSTTRGEMKAQYAEVAAKFQQQEERNFQLEQAQKQARSSRVLTISLAALSGILTIASPVIVFVIVNGGLTP